MIKETFKIIWNIGQFILFITLILLLTYDIYYTSKGCERCKLYNVTVEKSPLGVYMPYKDVLCISLDNREINATLWHEQTHLLIDQHYEHFCNNNTYNWSLH